MALAGWAYVALSTSNASRKSWKDGFLFIDFDWKHACAAVGVPDRASGGGAQAVGCAVATRAVAQAGRGLRWPWECEARWSGRSHSWT